VEPLAQPADGVALMTRASVPIVAVAAGSGSLYISEAKIQPRAVSGWFATWRWLLVGLTQALFYGLPWLQWNGRQSVLFDLAARRFYVFGMVLHPQDVIYLAGLLILSAYGAATPARRRSTPRCSCGSSTASKATGRRASGSTRRRGR